MKLTELQNQLYGSKAKNEVGEKTGQTVLGRLRVLGMGINNSTYGPTPLLQHTLKIVNTELAIMNKSVENSKIKHCLNLLKVLKVQVLLLLNS
jgi:hypothetical protein